MGGCGSNPRLRDHEPSRPRPELHRSCELGRRRDVSGTGACTSDRRPEPPERVRLGAREVGPGGSSLTRPGGEPLLRALTRRDNAAVVPSGLLNPALLAGATSPGACRSGAPPGANSTIAASQIVTKRHRTYGVSHPVGVHLLSPGRLTRCRRVAPPAGGRAGDPPVQYRGESHSRGTRKW